MTILHRLVCDRYMPSLQRRLLSPSSGHNTKIHEQNSQLYWAGEGDRSQPVVTLKILILAFV